MEVQPIEKSDGSLGGQVEIWQNMFSFADSMALKCAVELQIADILNSYGRPVTLSQIASSIDSPSPNLAYLSRIMRLLVRKKIFAAHHDLNGGETLYGFTDSSKWLLRDAELSLAPMILMENDEMKMASWHCLTQSVKEGAIPFNLAHGSDIWNYALQNPRFNKLLNDAMACTSKIISRTIASAYKDGFNSVNGSLVDVAGGIGGLISEIVKTYPHIKGINFDLPHVIATAPKYDGVTHVAGSMFQGIPKADAVILKWVLHDWNDEDCVKILRNCRKAIPEKTGKVIIVDTVVLRPHGIGLFDDLSLVFDVLMLAASTDGKERTEPEWKKILEEAGFPRYNIVDIPALPFIIEAFPE